MSTSCRSAKRSWRRLPYAATAILVATSVLFPLVSPQPAQAVIIDEIALSPGEVYVHRGRTDVPMGNNLGGLGPNRCRTGDNIYVPQSAAACHVFNVTIDAPREKILEGRLQLDIVVEYDEPTRIPNCSVPAITSFACATHTMAFEAWQDPPLQTLEEGGRQIHVDFPVIGYFEYPDDPTVPVCGNIDGLPQHPVLPGQDGQTVRCTGETGTLTNVPSAEASETFGSEFPPLIGGVFEAGKCPFNQDPDEEVQAQLQKANGICPEIYVIVASIIGTGDYTLSMVLTDLGTIDRRDLSAVEELIPGIDVPETPTFGGVEPPSALGGPLATGGQIAPGEALPLPGSSLPGFGAPDGSLSGIDRGSALGNQDLAAAIINRGRKPLPPPGDPSTALMLLSMGFVPIGGLATLLFLIFQRRRRDDALVAGIG